MGCFQTDEIEIVPVLNICWRKLGLQTSSNSLPQGTVPNCRICSQKHYHHMDVTLNQRTVDTEEGKGSTGSWNNQESEVVWNRVTFYLYLWWPNLNFLYPFCSTSASQALIILLSQFDRLEASCTELSVMKHPMRRCADASATAGYFQRRDECSQGHLAPLTRASAPRWTGGWAGFRDELLHQLCNTLLQITHYTDGKGERALCISFHSQPS